MTWEWHVSSHWKAEAGTRNQQNHRLLPWCQGSCGYILSASHWKAEAGTTHQRSHHPYTECFSLPLRLSQAPGVIWKFNMYILNVHCIKNKFEASNVRWTFTFWVLTVVFENFCVLLYWSRFFLLSGAQQTTSLLLLRCCYLLVLLPPTHYCVCARVRFRSLLFGPLRVLFGCCILLLAGTSSPLLCPWSCWILSHIYCFMRA